MNFEKVVFLVNPRGPPLFVKWRDEAFFCHTQGQRAFFPLREIGFISANYIINATSLTEMSGKQKENDSFHEQ